MSAFQTAIDACKEPYLPDNEDAAVEAVKSWLDNSGSNKVGEYKSSTPSMLLVASENGYPKVVKQLLEDVELVEVEVDNRAEELFRKYIQEGNAHAHQPSGFAEARKKLKAKMKSGAVPKDGLGVALCAEQYPGWKRQQVKEQARYKACYDMITLYIYIGEEIPDALTLIGVISTLRGLGWMSMDDIAADWTTFAEKIREELSRPNNAGLLSRTKEAFGLVQGTPFVPLDQLSEARYNYDGSWNKHFDEDDEQPPENKVDDKVCVCLSNVFCSALFLFLCSFLLSLIVLAPVINVLALRHDDAPVEKQLFWECYKACYVWLGLFALEQIGFALWTAPFIGWGMIKEASRDTDLGATLKGSMNMQGLISTFLFSTILARLQVGLDFPDDLDHPSAERALKQWYQGLIVLAIMHSALATIITIICRTHIDSLNNKAAINFALKNFLYFGLPMQLIFLAFVNTILALILWIFGTFGLIAGGFASVAAIGGMWALLYIWASVFYWKNEELPEKVRAKREKLRANIWRTRFPFIFRIYSRAGPYQPL